MFKKVIPLFLSICLILGLCIPVSATEYTLPDAEPVSEEIYGPAAEVSADIITTEPSDTVSGSAVSGLNSRIAGSTPQLSIASDAVMPYVDGTNADGSLNTETTIKTNLIENSSKYNGMAAGPVSEAPAASRYSTTRISLAPDIAGTKYEEAAELLGALGIMVGDAEDGAFRPNDPIIRSEMAKVAVYSVGLEDIATSASGSTRFPDVPQDHWATGAINVADQQGMVMGDDIGTFRPDDPVLLQEAIAIIVRAMGYVPAAAD